jgi:release factor glutamine methyltransferase
MINVLEVIKRSTEFLAGKGIEGARLNAEHLVGHALGLARMQLYLQFERPLTEAELERIRPLVRRRGLHEPLQYILGGVEFCGLKLKVDRRALIPRPETEHLVELVMERRQSAPPQAVLELGTGTGAIALALAARYPAAAVTAAEVDAGALALAAENAAANGLDGRVEWVASDWYEALPPGRRFDLIVSNPPYLSAAEVAETAPEVRNFEPTGALTPGGDGLAALGQITAGAPARLAPGGLIALETGIAQHEALRAQAAAAGLEGFESVPDLTGRPRYVFARAPG